jgi:hypothetical protein
MKGKNMNKKTIIKILDCGTYCEAEVERGVMSVTRTGCGCPVEEIIGQINYNPRRGIQKIADEVLSAWVLRYVGDPHNNDLTVEIVRGEYSIEVAA